MEKFDVIIAGSGIAGLSAALECAKTKQVVVIERGIEKTSNSYYAQGGIATAIGKNDSWEKHFEDTLKAGDGLCNVETVETITRNGPAAVKELINLGLVFDGESEPELGLEGGHSKNRVLHIKGDRTGKEMTLFLKKIAKENKNIDFIENTAVKKIYANKGNYSGIETNEGLMQSDSMVLATGGYAACFEKTTNPKTTTGLGMAIAIETGCEIWGMEFVQFHPTTIQTTIGNFLVTEAVRGEGGQIVNEDNEQIVNPLFTRDKVSRAIYREQLQGKKVFLDATEFNSGFFKKRFPSVYKELIANSINPEKDRIEIESAAHYTIGGVKTDSESMTTIKGLFAAGECTNSGLHGANRLASNSLLEGLVMGKIAGKNAADIKNIKVKVSETTEKEIFGSETKTVFDAMKKVMWRCCSVIRDEANLKDGLAGIRALKNKVEVNGKEENFAARKALIVCEKTFEAALTRKESVGTHYREN